MKGNSNRNIKALLVVDDETDVKPLFEHFFRDEIERNGLNLYYASSAHECLNLLNNINADRLLLLSDINMPEMSGVELSKKVRETYPSTIISFISAGTTIPIKRDYYDYFFSKPVDFDYLVPRIMNILNEV